MEVASGKRPDHLCDVPLAAAEHKAKATSQSLTQHATQHPLAASPYG